LETDGVYIGISRNNFLYLTQIGNIEQIAQTSRLEIRGEIGANILCSDLNVPSERFNKISSDTFQKTRQFT